MYRKQNKFNAKRTVVDGKHFPSRGEADLYSQLKFRQNIGEIKDLGSYYTVELTDAKIKWKVDFHYFCIKRNQMILAEFKGVELEAYILKKRLYEFYGKFILEVYKQNRRGIYLDETITPETLQKASP